MTLRLGNGIILRQVFFFPKQSVKSTACPVKSASSAARNSRPFFSWSGCFFLFFFDAITPTLKTAWVHLILRPSFPTSCRSSSFSQCVVSSNFLRAGLSTFSFRQTSRFLSTVLSGLVNGFFSLLLSVYLNFRFFSSVFLFLLPLVLTSFQSLSPI